MKLTLRGKIMCCGDEHHLGVVDALSPEAWRLGQNDTNTVPSANTAVSQAVLPSLGCREITCAFSHFSLKLQDSLWLCRSCRCCICRRWSVFIGRCPQLPLALMAIRKNEGSLSPLSRGLRDSAAEAQETKYTEVIVAMKHCK